MKVKNRRRIGLFFIVLGILLIAVTAALAGYNFYIDNKAAEGIEEIIGQISKEDALSSQPDYILNPDMEMPIAEIDGIDYVGILSIPALELELPIISECTYPNLRIAPCRYNGSIYLNNMVIAGHNYNSLFGSLKQLSVGDTIQFTDADGNVFHYEVADIQVLMPTAIEKMITGDWDLTLFTCTVGGRTRLTVRCDSIDNHF